MWIDARMKRLQMTPRTKGVPSRLRFASKEDRIEMRTPRILSAFPEHIVTREARKFAIGGRPAHRPANLIAVKGPPDRMGLLHRPRAIVALQAYQINLRRLDGQRRLPVHRMTMATALRRPMRVGGRCGCIVDGFRQRRAFRLHEKRWKKKAQRQDHPCSQNRS